MDILERDKAILKSWLGRKKGENVSLENFRNLVLALLVRPKTSDYREAIVYIAKDIGIKDADTISTEELEDILFRNKDLMLTAKPKHIPIKDFFWLAMGGIVISVAVSFWTFTIGTLSRPVNHTLWAIASLIVSIIGLVLLYIGFKKLPKYKRSKDEVEVKSVDDLVYAFVRIYEIKHP
ncbi:MAG: hypothetical protein ACP5LI_07115 [Hydrogenobaculum sp.]|nr:MAG: hypothetical protein C0170_01810 [Hydrogenobaculum sp.]